jgi:hypothetical protein
MALGIWRKWRKSGIEPFGRYGQPEDLRWWARNVSGRHKKAHFLKGSATSRTVRLRDLPPELFSNEAELVVLFRAKHNSLRDQIHHALSLAVLTQNS